MRHRFASHALPLAALALLAGCAAGVRAPAGDGPLVVRGELTIRERVALPYDGVATVELTRPADGRLVADQRIALQGRQSPIAFELKVHRAALGAATGYSLRGAIHAHGRAAWISDPVELPAGPGPIGIGALLLRPYQSVAFASALQCGPRTARADMVRRGTADVLRLTVDGDRFEMRGSVSASGVRYEAVDDAATELWLHGDRAMLTVRGERLPECVVSNEAHDAVRAHGNEPAWRLEIGSELRFASGDLRFDGTAPAAQASGNVRTYSGRVAGRIVNVVLTRGVCHDSMSGMPHPFAVEAIVDGRRFLGCGGDPEAFLLGREWVVEDVGGRMVDRSRATLDFGIDGRLAGRATCNAYTTSYTVTGERLAIGATAVTRSQCPPALMEQERVFLEILQRVRRFDITDTGALVLEDDRQRRIVARRGAN